jgi:hypothetical protein
VRVVSSKQWASVGIAVRASFTNGSPSRHGFRPAPENNRRSDHSVFLQQRIGGNKIVTDNSPDFEKHEQAHSLPVRNGPGAHLIMFRRSCLVGPTRLSRRGAGDQFHILFNEVLKLCRRTNGGRIRRR